MTSDGNLEAQPTRPPVSDGRIELDLLAPNDRTVALTIDGELREFPLSGEMSVQSMIRFLRLERDINDAFNDDDDDQDGTNAEPIETALKNANDEIRRLLAKRTPDPPELELGISQLTALLAWLAGDASVADAVARALSLGKSAAVDEEAVATASSSTPDEDGDAGSGGSGPLASAPLSSGRSSCSGGSTSGSPDGGGTAPGESSVSTSAKPTSS